MGYYSDAALLLSLQARQDLQDLVNKSEALAYFLDHAEYCGEYPCGAVLIQWNDVKWYDDSPDDPDFGHIAQLMEFIRGYDPDEIRFVRFGEDHEDVECIGYFSEPAHVGVAREITVE